MSLDSSEIYNRDAPTGEDRPFGVDMWVVPVVIRRAMTRW